MLDMRFVVALWLILDDGPTAVQSLLARLPIFHEWASLLNNLPSTPLFF